MMPSLLLWDLWVTRYRIRPKQVFFNAGGFLIFYVTLFAACIIVPTYFGWNNPVEVDDVMPMPMTAEEIVNSSKIGNVRIARGEELVKRSWKRKWTRWRSSWRCSGAALQPVNLFGKVWPGKSSFLIKNLCYSAFWVGPDVKYTWENCDIVPR